MFELITLDIDLQRVEKYKTFHTSEPSFLDKSVFIYIPSQYHETFRSSLKELLFTFKVDPLHSDYLLFIVGQHLSLLQTVQEMQLNASESVEPLRFLKAYLLQRKEFERPNRSKENIDKALKSRYLELVSPIYKSKHPIKIGNTDLIVKAIFQLFKSKYEYSLKEQLEQYDDIPSLDIIGKLLDENEYILNYATHYFIAQITLDLIDYIESNVEGQLSRKKYLFIFDFIFINGLFYLETEREPLYQVATDFKVPTYIPSTEKTLHIKTMLHRYRKYMKNK